MLDQSVAYVSARHQFGRPIASFQTVKHRLAEVHVAVTAARAGVATAWADGTRLSAMAAKCLGARAHDLASAHGHQVHGGLAFTVEYGFQRWIERGHLLDALLGTRRQLTATLGRACIEAGVFPRTPDLAFLS
jgi:alkylation response protein AidB-like acyl-CoA dehydrogenase